MLTPDSSAAERLADSLIKRKTVSLTAWVSCVVIIGGLWAWWIASPMVFARTGAAVTCLSLLHAYGSLRWSRMMDDVRLLVIDVFTGVEHQKLGGLAHQKTQAMANARQRVDRMLPDLVEQMQRRFLRNHLLVGGLGTAIWGFGDLLPF